MSDFPHNHRLVINCYHARLGHGNASARRLQVSTVCVLFVDRHNSSEDVREVNSTTFLASMYEMRFTPYVFMVICYEISRRLCIDSFVNSIAPVFTLQCFIF